MKQSTAHLIQTSRQSRPPASLKLPAGPKMRIADTTGSMPRPGSFPIAGTAPEIPFPADTREPPAGPCGGGLGGGSCQTPRWRRILSTTRGASMTAITPRGVLAHGAAQRVHMPNAQNQVAGRGMGIRGGAVCHMRSIYAGHSALRIPRSALGKRSSSKVSAVAPQRPKTGGRLVSIVRGQVSGDGGQRYDRGWGSVEKEESPL